MPDIATHDTVSESALREAVSGRRLYLWGASIVGYGMCRALERLDLPPTAFLDKSPRMADELALGYPVWHPRRIVADPVELERAFIVITSGHYEDEIATACEQAGLVAGVDYVRATQLNATDPSVDITGMCNLHCMSCPRGNFEDQGTRGYMDAQTYGAVLDKLCGEIPFLGSVQLYAWGEPLLNPQASDIIRMTVERKILCAISTNLNVKRDFRAAIAAKPDWLKVSASGYGPTYAITHTGGKWPLFLKNLRLLQQYRKDLHPGMYVELNYHLYKHTSRDEFESMAQLCKELGFAFRPNWAYLYPLDHVMSYRLGKPLPEEAHQTLDRLLLDIDEGLARADQEAHLPCAEERCLPITWDGQVRSCGSYFEPTVSDNFLRTPLEELRRRRTESGICERCKAQSLHRFTSTYVRECEPRVEPPTTHVGRAASKSPARSTRNDLIQIREVRNL